MIREALTSPTRKRQSSRHQGPAHDGQAGVRRHVSDDSQRHGVRLAGEALAAYQALGPTARDAFFELLSGSFLPDPKFVAAAATAYQREPSAASLSRLQAAVAAVLARIA